MTPSVAGVRQNLRLIVDNGHVPASVNQDVEASWGATLGGGYYVWRSGLGITRDGRAVFAYGPALDVQDLADLLQRAGAVEGMQLDPLQPGLHRGLRPMTAGRWLATVP